MNIWPKSEYVKHLEAERERLLLREQQLMDALLKANGLPVFAQREAKPLPTVKQRWLPSQWRKNLEARHLEKERNGEEKTRA